MGVESPVVLRILICDDAAAFSLLLSKWMTADDQLEVVGTTSDPDEAVLLAKELLPDVVVLDHLLGNDTSATLVPRLRAAAPRIRILLISGMPTDRLEEASASSGADGFVSKASSGDHLRRAVHAVAASS